MGFRIIEAHALGSRSTGQLHGRAGHVLGEGHNGVPDVQEVSIFLCMTNTEEAEHLVAPPVCKVVLHGAMGWVVGMTSDGA